MFHKKLVRLPVAIISLFITGSMLVSCATAVHAPNVPPGSTPPATTPGMSSDVPAEDRGLYNFLDSSLDTMIPRTSDNPGKATTMVASNLLLANSNALPDIADNPRNLTSVGKTLDMFADMGLKVVDVTIQYPTLVKEFPRSQDYLEYYKKVVQEARKRQLKLAVEVGSTFTSPVFAKLPVKDWYEGLTKERYCREKRQMIETIINELGPDYLALEEEPTTQHTNIGLSYTVEDVKYYMDYFLKDLDTKNIPIGAGAGLWDDQGYWDLYLNNPKLDFIDFHIYPVNDPQLSNKLRDLSQRAAEKGKKVVVGEAWLYKTNGREQLGGPVAMSETVFARDAYSFWQPLDIKFIDTLLDMASTYDWEYVNFFWSKCFFAYVDYGETTKDVTKAYALQQQNASINIYKKELTATGKHLKDRLTQQ